MSPLKKGKKKGKKKEEELEKVEEKVEVAPKEVEPITWFSELTSLGDVRTDIPLLPDVDIQFQISNSLVRFVKKGLEKPVLSEERSLRPDAVIMISDKAWRELVKTQGLDEFVNLYRKYSRNPSPEEFIRVNISQQKLLSDRGILRSKLFKALLLS
nr:hypothetical protein [Candidatus Njordarchaeota archaeon]